MKKNNNFTLSHLLIFILLSLSLSSTEINVHEIEEDLPGVENYKYVQFESEENTINYYFKYTVKSEQKSKIDAFRIKLDKFTDASLEKNEVFCTFLQEDATNDNLIEALEKINSQSTSCIGQFGNSGTFDGIIKYDDEKPILAIIFKAKGDISFEAKVYIHTTAQILENEEKKITSNELYSLIPYTISTSVFYDNSIPNILLYSYNREMQVYYIEKDTPYPKKLFSGNILSIYTDPNMVHQKYHDAKSMFLLSGEISQEESEFEFQLIFPKDYLLDYYVSNNPNGRSKNRPLAINMNQCETPYYFILNYNKPENETSLYIDKIYGKIKSLSVATDFKNKTWSEMIENDMQEVQVSSRKFTLPKESKTHMDVYKLECVVPLLLNFYYVDETADIPSLDYGQVSITTIKPYQIIYFPFTQGISQPKLTIEIFNPITLPLIYLNYEENEIIFRENYLMEFTPNSTESPIIIKEKGGYSDTRIIIKVGYNTENWEKKEDNLYYNSTFNMYVFSFPNDESKLNYTQVNLVTKGVNEGDNVKYCYGTNLGSAIIPSDENCYRTSKENPYELKFLNPFVMHKDYYIYENLIYYISIKPVVLTQKIEIEPELYAYDTKIRNFEGMGNIIGIDSFGKASTILSSPKDNYVESIFVQIQHCDLKELEFSIFNTYDNQEILTKNVSEVTINFFKIFNNTLLDTLLHIEGEKNSEVFVKHAGVYNWYSLNIKNSPNITFNSDLNELEIESPFLYEEIKYTIYISKSDELSRQDITLCSFAKNNFISIHNKTISSYRPKVSVSFNFKKMGFEKGETFEVLVHYEQQSFTKMEFISDVERFTVGEPKIDEITEIKNDYAEDTDYVYAEGELRSDHISYYYSYLPEKTLDIPFGTFSIELNTTDEAFSRVDCAFADIEDDTKSMVDAIQNVIDTYNSYCTGGKSETKGNIYNYVFRYTYKDSHPRKLIIKLSNENSVNNVSFSIYIRKEKNIEIESVDKEYGEIKENKKTVIPYIFDLEKIRGTSEKNYISKILVYSKHFNMQMYYIEESKISNAPRKIFNGNVLLVYTNPDLAIEKYMSTKLILLAEDLIEGQEHTSEENKFRFHTKMYESDANIEYYLFSNVVGYSLSYPLSLQINTCSKENNKHYYIINYEKALDKVTLYLDLVYGSMKSVRISTDLDAHKWDDIIKDNMEDINEYQLSLANKTNHIHIIEIECNSPLLLNVYLNYDDYFYYLLKNGNFVIKTLNPKESKSFTIDISQFRSFYYTLSLLNSIENPNIEISYSNIRQKDTFKENCLYYGQLSIIPEEITVTNNGGTATRFIYKIGYGVQSEWNEEKKNLEGKLYNKNSMYVYKFPEGENRKNFTSVLIDVKPMKTEAQQPSSIKFCYSVSMGIPIEVSYENCFRTGENIPYSLTFLNPLNLPKIYKSYSEDYYITLSSYYQPFDYITVDIKENKYDTNERIDEGVPNLIKLENQEKSIILSLPEKATNADSLLIQMQLCSSSEPSINYKIIDPLTNEENRNSKLDKKTRLFTLITNVIENELKLNGNKDDLIYEKHISLTNYKLKLQNYIATIGKKNTVIIEKPILNEEFNITIFIGKKGAFANFTLCTFYGIAESQYKDLADYVKTIKSNTNDVITEKVDYGSLGYKNGDEFDLLVYAVQIENPKLEILYEVVSGKVEGSKKEEDDKKKSNLVWIIPVVVVIVVIIIIVIILLIRLHKKKNNIDELISDGEDKDKEMILPLKEV